jgi:outer membrane receptor for monomeric catechols
MNPKTNGVVDMKKAVAIAKAFVRDLFSDEKIEVIELDEADFGGQSGDWLITVSVQKALDPKQHSALSVALQRVARERKTIRINPDSGQVLSVTNFKPVAALA